jgi:hypothetical protein
LTQAQNDFGFVLPDGIDELAPVKSYREDNFSELPPPGQPADDFFRDVVAKPAVGTEAVDQYAHGCGAHQNEALG